MDKQLDIIRAIQNTQRKISIITGFTMGILLIVYFFTFAMLIDKGYSFLLKFEIVTTVIFVIAFFFLNKLSFQLTRLVYMRQPVYGQLLSKLKSGDINKTPEEVQTDIAKRHAL